jgi:hypothetical protein
MLHDSGMLEAEEAEMLLDSGMLEAVASPFTPDDNPVYELCADDTSPQRLGSLLGSVPEDEPACAPAVAGSSPAAADILQPGALQLPTVRTPRKPRFQSSVEVPEAEKARLCTCFVLSTALL